MSKLVDMQMSLCATHILELMTALREQYGTDAVEAALCFIMQEVIMAAEDNDRLNELQRNKETGERLSKSVHGEMGSFIRIYIMKGETQ